MVFGSRNKVKKAKNVTIKIGDKGIKQVPSFKYLGLTFDSTLNYNHHIASVIRTIIHKMTLLAKLKRYLRGDTTVSIYKTMLLPYFDYADIIYNKAFGKDIAKL